MDKQNLVQEERRTGGGLGVRHLVIFMGFFFLRNSSANTQSSYSRVSWVCKCVRHEGELVGGDSGDGEQHSDTQGEHHGD